MPKRAWLWFWLWAIPGVALGFQVSVIGVFFVLPGLVVALLLVGFGRTGPEALGVVAGIGVTCLVIALLAVLAGDWPGECPASGEIVTRTRDSVTSESCNRWFAVGWLIPGLVLMLGATLRYRVAARRSRATT